MRVILLLLLLLVCALSRPVELQRTNNLVKGTKLRAFRNLVESKLETSHVQKLEAKKRHHKRIQERKHKRRHKRRQERRHKRRHKDL